MISATVIKPNDETVSEYSLPLYNLGQNKSFSMNYSNGWVPSELSPQGYSKHPSGEVQKGKQLNKHYRTWELF